MIAHITNHELSTKHLLLMTDHTNMTAEDAVKIIQSGNRVFIHGSAATPSYILAALQKRYEELTEVELVSITTFGDISFDDPLYKHSFFVNSLFVSANTRSVVNSEHGDYVPIFLSQIPQLFKRNILPLDVAIVQVSSPDAHGFCSLGTSVDIARAAVDTAKSIIALVNKKMPRTHGDGFVHISRFNSVVWHDSELPEIDYQSRATDIVAQIGRNVASLVEDGATLQLGIGAIPDQVLRNLSGHKSLGLHTEMLSDGVIPLIEKGVIDNSRKKLNVGRSVTSSWQVPGNYMTL